MISNFILLLIMELAILVVLYIRYKQHKTNYPAYQYTELSYALLFILLSFVVGCLMIIH